MNSQLAEKSLIPMKNEVDLILSDDGNIGRYERKRCVITIAYSMCFLQQLRKFRI